MQTREAWFLQHPTLGKLGKWVALPLQGEAWFLQHPTLRNLGNWVALPLQERLSDRAKSGRKGEAKKQRIPLLQGSQCWAAGAVPPSCWGASSSCRMPPSWREEVPYGLHDGSPFAFAALCDVLSERQFPPAAGEAPHAL